MAQSPTLLALALIAAAAPVTVAVPASLTVAAPAPMTVAAGTPGASPPATASRPDLQGTPAGDPTAGRANVTPPAVVAVYPNPVHDGDRGEFVVLALGNASGRGAANWTLSDGEDAVTLPEGVGGTVVVTAEPATVRPLVDRRVVAVPELPALSNGGETVRLRRDGQVVDAVTYPDAPESERYRPGAGFEPLGATDFAVATAADAAVTAFALPDAASMPVAPLRNASRRILLGGYTLTSRRVADALIAAAGRGVDVRVLIEGGPVGGLARREGRLLDQLVAAGVAVRVVGGPRARYDHHHAKYAVVDDRAVVLSENWKPSGTGGHGSRGWGTLVDAAAVADHLARVFRADAGWRDARPWRRVRANASFEPTDPATADYPARFVPRRFEGTAVQVLAAPDNAEGAILSLLGAAEESILVQQVSIGGRHTPFLRAVLSAARRGVRVRILLSSAWYVREENRRLVEWLNGRADSVGWDLTARLAAPESRFEKVHNKGAVVDGRHALVGSVNWNNHSVRENREVALVLSGPAAAYYARVFRADWQGGRPRGVPAGLLLAVAIAVVLAARWGYERIEFE